LGSSNVHLDESILIALGTPEKHLSKNSLLAQENSSMFGKILEIKKKDLNEVSEKNTKELKIKIFSKGHRVPQGLTILNNKVFNVEHGPKGGDELNQVVKDKNYGWPVVSYGTNYLKDSGGDGKSIKVNHEEGNYEEPLFAFVPSVGISALNNCPFVLKNYYKKPCLIALSLYGNNLRKGHSLIIFLLNENLDKIQSIEKIFLNNLVLRHFVTDKKNIIYEDNKGAIYISADKKGIYKIEFTDFR
jgi:glucose/arabinose dehydrogenase